METTKIIEILKQVDINILLRQNTLKAVLADLLYEYETERKILNTVNNSVNVLDKLYKSKNKLLEIQSIKKELLSYGLNTNTVEWALSIWSGVLDFNNIQNIENQSNQVFKLSTGGSFTIALIASEKLYAWGNNKWGQLGNSSLTDSIKPIDITDSFNLNGSEKFSNIYSSFRSSYLLTNEGRLYAWGNNEHGQLGDATKVNRIFPIEITNRLNLNYGEKILRFSTGGFHSLLVTSNNRLFAWGNNEFGQLGDGTNVNKNIPVDITNMLYLKYDEKIENIYVGLGHSMVLTSSGRIFTWGNNEYGQLGDGSTTKKNMPVDITRNFSFMNNEKIHNAALGSLHSLVVSNTGRVFVFGNNESGQLGDTTMTARVWPVDITSNFNYLNEEKVILLSAGRNYSFALTSLGRVYSWGNNKNGQLGIENYISGTTGPIEITNKIISNEEDFIVNIITGATSMHSYAISSKGKVYAWGNNEYGQIGEGSTVEKRSPIELKLN